MLELMQGQAPNGIYNFGMGKARTWIELAECIFKALDREMKIEFIDMPEAIRSQYQYFTEADMQKSFEIAHLSPPIWTLEKSIEDYVAWLQVTKS
jgi:ADP-L-glycero-D-manno-heptose 6-epimerase